MPSNSLGHLALQGGLRKVWTADAGTGSSSSGRLSAVPLVAGGKVFTLDAAGDVSAFSTSSGAKVWSTSLTPENEKSSEGFGGGLALEGNTLYATTGYGTVVALNPASGAVQWTKAVGKPIRNSPTVAAGKIFFVSTDNNLYALSASTGEQAWKQRGLPQSATLLSNASPAVSGGIVVAPFPAGDIIAYEAGSGKTAWRDSLSRSTEKSASGVLGDPARPVVDRGVVYAVSHGGRMIATSLASAPGSGRATWRARKCLGSRAMRCSWWMSPTGSWRSAAMTERCVGWPNSRTPRAGAARCLPETKSGWSPARACLWASMPGADRSAARLTSIRTSL
nr:PQQ-binding-like beta-propeller repeat protein [Methyloceanibacter marginalis]